MKQINWARTQAWRFVKLQSMASLTLAALLLLITGDIKISYSLLIGGVICILPNCFFILLLFRYQGAQQARLVLRSFYVGEMIKLLLTVSLLCLVSFTLPVIAPMLLLGYLVAQQMIWLGQRYFNTNIKGYLV